MAQPFDSLARVSLATLPTPLHDATRLRAVLGGPAKCPRILIKRDDLTGLAFGGNKVRKLEFLVADALAQGATHLITTGAAQSNHARATVAAGVIYGLKTILVLDTDTPEVEPQGNLLLDHLMGADVRLVPKGTDRDAVMAEIGEQIAKAGGRAYIIPVGGSNALGSVGYLTMVAELAEQLRALDEKPRWLHFASGSRGTQAGISLGARLFGLSCEPVGILISSNAAAGDAKAVAVANSAAELIGSEIRFAEGEIRSVDGYIGEGYAVPTKSGDDAIRLLARTEAIFLDPVYTGKAMGAVIDRIAQGEIGSDETVVFVHTGGGPSLFAHAGRLIGHGGQT